VPNSLKVVLDLNLFVSALIGRPATAQLLEHWRNLLEVAATARANYLATGDKDLLDDPVLISKMREEYRVEIVTASRLLEILTNEMS